MTKPTKLLVIIDPGHGGIKNGVYQTAGKQFKHTDGTQIFEGDFNRKVAAILAQLLDINAEIDYIYTVAPNNPADISLGERCRIANAKYNQVKNNYAGVVFVSIHGNAFSLERANGFSVFTTKGQTKSDKLAELLYSEIQVTIPDYKHRADTTDGDHDWEEQFYVLKNTLMPAILSENYFMTNLKDCKFMLSADGQRRIAIAHSNALELYRKSLLTAK